VDISEFSISRQKVLLGAVILLAVVLDELRKRYLSR